MYYECNYYFSILLLHLLLSIDNYYLLYITYISCERVGGKYFKKQGQQDHRSSAKNSVISSLSNSKWQNRKERPNRTTSNGYGEKAKHDGVSESVKSI